MQCSNKELGRQIRCIAISNIMFLTYVAMVSDQPITIIFFMNFLCVLLLHQFDLRKLSSVASNQEAIIFCGLEQKLDCFS